MSAFHIYGYSRSGLRSFSFSHVFAGPQLDPLASANQQGIFGQALFVMGLIVLVNALLQRTLRDRRRF